MRLTAFSLALVATLAVLPASAETRSILVLDASGSMWGQIDGEAKITIAQRVLSDLLDAVDDTDSLGLIAYGHRRKGDCGDIEVLVPPAPGGRETIRRAVSGISPKGKTPLSAAVIQAAETLKYEEERASVILVSDGRETCDLDPCEVGRQLEATGVDFTAHVVGFDVRAKEDQRQLACLAEATGGRFLTAATATELREALKTVSEPPEPVMVDTRLRATEGEDGPIITQGLRWTLTPQGDAAPLLSDIDTAGIHMALAPGDYRAEVVRPADATRADLDFTLEAGPARTLSLPLEVPMAAASLEAPPNAPAGEALQVVWEGPDEPRDYLSIAAPEQPPHQYDNYAYTRDGSPLTLIMPPEPGEYEIRYVQRRDSQVLARVPITITPVTASLEAPPNAPAGESLTIAWQGPDYPRDYLSIAAPNQPPHQYANYAYTRDGSPLTLTMPPEPGEYEIRYVQRQGSQVLAHVPITITAVTASLEAPPNAPAGESLTIAWQGPDYPRDYLSIAAPGQPPHQYANYAYTRDGSPLELTMPPEPGEYEIRYVQRQGSQVLARVPITITAVTASIDAPPSALAGDTLQVVWQGPAYPRDYLSIAAPDQPPHQYANYAYTRTGSPLALTMPPEPGDYEIRYIQRQGSQVLAHVPITITAVTASLEAPPSALAGESLEITWQGPDYPRDYLSIAAPEQPSHQYQSYAYTRQGSPLTLTLPTEPGDYEIRYVQRQGSKVLASVRLEIRAAPD
ncbi:vWA domain-containing protein [Onishia niordana]|uniref:vWA domain-containing protein n=1 Tax=Onishia niordana TaxID=2508711 RepID=UPI00109F1E7F|nr:VWA domain-containing protein [Halomonas niordiana]